MCGIATPGVAPPRSRFPPYPSDDFPRLGEALLLVLAEHSVVVDVDVEDPPSPFLELRLDAERLAQLVGQANGLAIVVSRLAPDNLDPHQRLRFRTFTVGKIPDAHLSVHVPSVPLAFRERRSSRRRSHGF
jgi:hypothetical protein